MAAPPCGLRRARPWALVKVVATRAGGRGYGGHGQMKLHVNQMCVIHGPPAPPSISLGKFRRRSLGTGRVISAGYTDVASVVGRVWNVALRCRQGGMIIDRHGGRDCRRLATGHILRAAISSTIALRKRFGSRR